MKAPAFWQEDGLAARVLAPAGWLYGAAGAVRWRCARPEAPPVPVICVGNATVGGTGKTPIVLDLLARLRQRGVQAHALCRGHGGRLRGPKLVEGDHDTAVDVGDEALLLARVAPTWIARDRRAGAVAAAAAGAVAIVLDDGLQYPHLTKTESLLVVDAATGFGNGRLLPAGPLREPSSRACDRASVAVLVGDGPFEATQLAPHLRPAWRCTLQPTAAARALAGRRVIAFAGIGRPEKFFATLDAVGARMLRTRAFADHHPYTGRELFDLLQTARAADALLVTTAKDSVRLAPAWRSEVMVVDVEVLWNDAACVESWLMAAVVAG